MNLPTSPCTQTTSYNQQVHFLIYEICIKDYLCREHYITFINAKSMSVTMTSVKYQVQFSTCSASCTQMQQKMLNQQMSHQQYQAMGGNICWFYMCNSYSKHWKACNKSIALGCAYNKSLTQPIDSLILCQSTYLHSFNYFYELYFLFTNFLNKLIFLTSIIYSLQPVGQIILILLLYDHKYVSLSNYTLYHITQ